MNRGIPLVWALIAACEHEKSTIADPPSLSAEEEEEVLPSDGCITINGSGGFSTIAEALEWAEEGDTVSICSGIYAERVVIQKSLTLKGPTSGEPAVIRNTEDTSAVSIRADGVSLSWLTIESSGVGVYAEEVDTVNLRVLTLAETGGIPVRVKGATNVLLQSSTFSDREGTMVYIDQGGSMRVVNSLFDRIAGYATVADTGATLSLEGNEFLDTAADSTERTAAARANNGAAIYSTGNLYRDSLASAVKASDSIVQSVSDTFQGGTHAITISGGSLNVDGATITHPTVTGIYAHATEGAVSISNSTFTADPAGHVLGDVEAWSITKADQGVGIFAKAMTAVHLENVGVTGFNHGGIYIGPTTGEPIEVSLTSVNVDNVGWHGMYVRDASVTVTDTTVADITVHESTTESLCTTVGDYGGATFRTSTVDWLGGGATDTSGIGIAGLDAELSFSGVSISGNGCAGIMNFQGTLTVDDSDFSAPSTNTLGASIVSYNGSTSSVTNSRFVDSYEVAESFRTGSDSFLEVYYDRVGADIQAWYDGDHTVSGNTFTSGSRSIFGTAANLTVTNNSWSDYAQYGALIVDGTLTMAGNTFSSSAGHAAACIGGTVSLTDQVVDTTVATEDRSYEIWSGGEIIYPSAPANVTYPSIYFEGCESTMDSVALNDTAAMAMRLLGGTHALSDLTVLRANSGGYSFDPAIDLRDTWSRDGLSYEDDVAFTLDQASIAETGFGGAIGFTRYDLSGDAVRSTIAIANTSISSTGGAGVTAIGANLSLSDTEIAGSTGNGVTASQGDLNMNNVLIDSVGSSGLLASSATSVLEAVTVQYSGLNGIAIDGGAITLSESTSKNNGLHGVQLSSVVADLTGNSFTNNAGYGLSCAATTILACDNLFGDNLLGPTDTCWDECTGLALPADDDTGVPDTGSEDTGFVGSGVGDTGAIPTEPDESVRDTGDHTTAAPLP